MTLTTIVLVPLLVASVVLLFSFVGCVPRVRFRSVGPHLSYRPGASGVQSVLFVISEMDSRRRDRLVLARGGAVRRLMEAPDRGPMFSYSSRFSELGTGEAVHTLGLEDLATPTTGTFVIRCIAFTTPDASGSPLVDTDAEMPNANVSVTRAVVDMRPEPFPRPAFRLLPDFPPLPGERPIGPTAEIRAGEPSLPPAAHNVTLLLDVNPDLFGSRPASADFTITPAGGTPRTVTVAPGARPGIPVMLGSGTAEYEETDIHITFWLRLLPVRGEDWRVTVTAGGITSPPATVHVDSDPERNAAVEFRAHPWDGETGTPAIGVEWTDGA
jgi:hypothetical protein